MKLLLISLFLLSSCSYLKKWSFKKEDKDRLELESYSEFSKQDYIDQIKHFEKTYLEDKKKKVVPTLNTSAEYLESIVESITKNNELFFNQTIKPKFYFIKSNIPYHFSLPGRVFFFSTTLLNKYIKNETMLYCLIVYELIRSERGIYRKNIIIPTGTLSTRRMLSLLRLETSDKIEVHKWAFYILKRIGFDSDSYLSWLQVKNRNLLDFSMQLGDIQAISREESLFKSFLIEEVKNFKKRSVYKGSSKKFYTFIRTLKRS